MSVCNTVDGILLVSLGRDRWVVGGSGMDEPGDDGEKMWAAASSIFTFFLISTHDYVTSACAVSGLCVCGGCTAEKIAV